ncbi:MAG: phosphotransferase, partial [Gammaproteobacteria bacterium]|nr:phosphotransferase [Gammaproteobacteria bacterium]
MTDSCLLPDFSIPEATLLVSQLFNLDGELRVLNGERDLNYLVTTDSGKFVFKIANEHESESILECQHLVFQRLAKSSVFSHQTISQESVNGRVIESIEDKSGKQHLCRLLNYVEGRLLSEVNPHFPELLYDLGSTLATVDQSLLDFEHPALDRPLLWKMHEVLDTLNKFKPLLASREKRTLVEYFESRFGESLPELENQLRRSPIHNDANDNNILIEGDSAWQQQVSSIIDFGDMVYSWTVTEPAVAAAYAMLGKDHPLDAAVAIIRGYHQQLALNPAEIQIFFDLICMRLCMSVCVCAHQRSLDPDNQYLSISEKPAWALLQKLRNIPASFAHYVFRQACGLEAVPRQPAVIQWLQEQSRNFRSVVDIDFENDPLLW